MRFRNIATGEIRERAEDHPEYPRLVRQTHRWEQLPDRVDLDQSIPAILESVETPAQAQEALEAEAARETPRSTLLEALAQIVSRGEEVQEVADLLGVSSDQIHVLDVPPGSEEE